MLENQDIKQLEDSNGNILNDSMFAFFYLQSKQKNAPGGDRTRDLRVTFIYYDIKKNQRQLTKKNELE